MYTQYTTIQTSAYIHVPWRRHHCIITEVDADAGADADDDANADADDADDDARGDAHADADDVMRVKMLSVVMTTTMLSMMVTALPNMSNRFSVCLDECSRFYQDGITIVEEVLNPAPLRNISLQKIYQSVQL